MFSLKKASSPQLLLYEGVVARLPGLCSSLSLTVTLGIRVR
jgi:hypothetical protein